MARSQTGFAVDSEQYLKAGDSFWADAHLIQRLSPWRGAINLGTGHPATGAKFLIGARICTPKELDLVSKFASP
jgi:hypothetical protein